MRPAYAIGRPRITGAYGLVGCPERRLTNIRGRIPRPLVKNWPRGDGVGRYGRSRGRTLARNRRVVETSREATRIGWKPCINRRRRRRCHARDAPCSRRPLVQSAPRLAPVTRNITRRVIGRVGYRSTTRRYTPYGISGTGSPQALVPSVAVATCSSRTRRA